MAADFTYEPILAIDAVTLAPVGGVTGTVTDADTGAPVTTYNMGGVVTPLVTNARGYIPQFKASAPRIAVAFGSLTMEKEAIENDSRIIDEAVAANTASLTSTFVAQSDAETIIDTRISETPSVAAAVADVVTARDLIPRSEGALKTKEVRGGQFLAPVRVPHLVVDDAYPKASGNHTILWANPDTGLMYGAAQDKSFLKSTDHGKTWALRSVPSAEVGAQGIFLRLATGTLLGYRASTPPTIARSTDDGATWTDIHTLRASTVIMGPTAWTEDHNGHVYYGEYQTVDTFTEIRVYRSTDDGATFALFHTFPGPAGTDPARVRHVHSVQFDPISQRVYVMTGDSEVAAGVYRTNATTGATALERVVDNGQLSGVGTTLARTIGMMFFPDYLAWGVDATVSPYLVRMARTQIGTATPTAEIVYELNSTAWWSTRASTDGSTWIFSASKEGATPIDKAVHLYAVEDNGATVWELGSLPQYTGGATGSVSPVGKPEMYGDRVWLTTFNMFREDGTRRRLQVAARLARGFIALPAAVRDEIPVLAWQSISSGLLSITGAQTIPIGQTRSGNIRKRLLIHDWCVRRTTGTGTAKIQIYNLSTSAVVWESTVTGTIGSQRSTLGRDEAPWIEEVAGLSNSQALEIRVVTTVEFTGNIQLTYGWAE